MLCGVLRLEPETPLGLYLGCNITQGEAELKDKIKVRTVTFDMETCLDMTVLRVPMSQNFPGRRNSDNRVVDNKTALVAPRKSATGKVSGCLLGSFPPIQTNRRYPASNNN